MWQTLLKQLNEFASHPKNWLRPSMLQYWRQQQANKALVDPVIKSLQDQSKRIKAFNEELK